MKTEIYWINLWNILAICTLYPWFLVEFLISIFWTELFWTVTWYWLTCVLGVKQFLLSPQTERNRLVVLQEPPRKVLWVIASWDWRRELFIPLCFCYYLWFDVLLSYLNLLTMLINEYIMLSYFKKYIIHVCYNYIHVPDNMCVSLYCLSKFIYILFQVKLYELLNVVLDYGA